jgi:hypothetical protein
MLRNMRTKLVLTGVFGVRLTVTFIAALLLVSCGGDTKPAPSSEPVKQAEVPKPADESRRFPTANLTGTEVVDRQLMGKAFMPGGTIAHYVVHHGTGKVQYDLFAARLADANAAAFWRKALSDGNTAAQLIPSFGGYFGSDAGRPVFVFSRGAWIAGVAGLPLKDADAEARTLAARLN